MRKGKFSYKTLVMSSVIAMLGIAPLYTSAHNLYSADEKHITYIPHEPIIILRDSDFSNITSAGNGTPENPYIIENYMIAGHGGVNDTYGILIDHVTAHFIIRNCYISNYRVGIELRTCVNFMLANNIVSADFVDLFLDTLPYRNVTIKDNCFMNTGIFVEDAPVRDLENVSVENNTMGSSEISDILFFYNLRNNSLTKFTCGQIFLHNCTNVTVSELRVSNGASGITLSWCTNCTILRSRIHNNAIYGIYTQCSSYNKITSNIIYNASGGIRTADTPWAEGYNEITENTVINGSTGISLGYTANNVISNNSLINCGECGIALCVASNNNISFNRIFHANNGTALYGQTDLLHSLFSSDENVFYHNCFVDCNLWNIFIPYCGGDYNTFFNNVFVSQYTPSAGMERGLTNYFNTTGAGNYWSDWHEPDANHDGIVDNPYPIYDFTGNITTYDYYPLTKPPAVFILHTPVLDALTEQDVVFNASVLAYENLSAVKLLYKLRNESTYKAVSMHFVNQDGMLRNYTCNLTMPVFPAEVKYYLYAEDIDGKNDTTPVYTINVQGVPSSPRNLSATPGNKVVHLTWEAPAENGGLPITGYRIYYGTNPGNYTANITVGNVTEYTITNLTNGQTYYFAVSAINSVGEGAKSTEVSATPGTEPTLEFEFIPSLYAGVVCAGILMLWRKKRM